MKSRSPSKRYLKHLLPAVVFANACCLVTAACAEDIAATAHHALQMSVPQAVSSGQITRLAALSPSQHLKFALTLPLRNEDELDHLLTQIYDPQSPNYHQYLNVQEFTDRFGPTQQDYDAVVAWAETNGLKVTDIASNRHLIDVEGDVATINRALHITMATYRHPTENRSFYAPDREPSLSLGVPLQAISGLSNINLPRNHLLRGSPTQHARAVSRITGSGPGGDYLPNDIRVAYYGNGKLTGAGQVVGIFALAGYDLADLQLFYKSAGMKPTVPVKNVLVNGFSGSCGGCDDGEQVLDIGNVIGMAPGLKQVLNYEGANTTDILNKMATDNIAKVLTTSWYSNDYKALDDKILKQFAAQGQSFLNASGDGGAYDSATWGPPSANPYVIEVGGTSLVTKSAGGAWTSESGWSGSGGGYYQPAGYAIPAYQKLAGVITASNKGSRTLRNDPDISLEADFDNITVSGGSVETGVAGTSYAAPRWAGLLALANQQSVAAHHGTVGMINPKLYALGLSTKYRTVMHDITVGSNPAGDGGNAGFKAVAGFDLVTGWGTPSGQAFIDALTGP